MNETLFHLFAVVSVLGALGMVLNVRNVVAGALCLVATMVALGGIYVLLEAFLVGVIQVMVYAGAIVVVFLFVVMLLNLRRDEFGPARQRFSRWIGAAVGVLVLAQFFAMLRGGFGPPAELAEGWGGYRQVGLALFRDWVLAFELTSLLLLAAMVGAVILAKRRID
jgi:NADH-quinone oxidoreductase subunit J